jgi:hypothetical protein
MVQIAEVGERRRFKASGATATVTVATVEAVTTTITMTYQSGEAIQQSRRRAIASLDVATSIEWLHRYITPQRIKGR